MTLDDHSAICTRKGSRGHRYCSTLSARQQGNRPFLVSAVFMVGWFIGRRRERCRDGAANTNVLDCLHGPDDAVAELNKRNWDTSRQTDLSCMGITAHKKIEIAVCWLPVDFQCRPNGRIPVFTMKGVIPCPKICPLCSISIPKRNLACSRDNRCSSLFKAALAHWQAGIATSIRAGQYTGRTLKRRETVDLPISHGRLS